MVTLIRAELRKLLGLPTAWAGLVLGVLPAPVIVLLNAPYTRRSLADGTLNSPADLGLTELGVALLGPTILGVVAVSSEYTSTGPDSPGARQLTATLTAMPDRRRLLAAKTAALMLVVAVQAVIATTATLTLAQMLYGENVPVPAAGRIAAVILYWVLTALLAYSITLITRNGIVPLTVLIINSTVVSLSYLLTKVTELAVYLPDIAGAQMFIRGADFEVEIAPVTAGLVMTAWIVALLAVGAVLFHRRDA
jgi:ABC-type transport system involved in multi-copper enzyme maturation permease subunit